MICRPQVALYFGCILWLQALPVPAADLDLKLADSLPAPGNNLVQLRSVGANPAPAETTADAKKYLNIARSDDSVYAVALKSIEHAGANQFFTYEFLVWRNSGRRDTTQVLFNLTSTGSFADFFKDVPFSVLDGAGQAHGNINIPIPSLDPAPVCDAVAIPRRTSPLRVILSGETEYTISLSCSGSASVPRLVSLSKPYGRKEYWKRLDYESQYYNENGPTKPVAARTFDLLKANLTPNVLRGVGARFQHLNLNEAPDDTIVFDLTYASQPAGLEIPMKIEIPISFYPYISVIAVSLSLGVLVGWVGLILLFAITSRLKPMKPKVLALFLGFVLSVISFLLILLAHSANCRLSLFGVEVNPSDVLVLFVIGLICECFALVKAKELAKLLDQVLDRMKLGGAPAAGLLLVLLAGFMCASAQAGAGDLALVGLSACPDGDVIGLSHDGTVIKFSGNSIGAWNRVGRLSSRFNAVEIACGVLDGRKTAFVVAMALQRVWVVRMDVATGRWSEGQVTVGTSAGIAFDPASKGVFVSSVKERAIYLLPSALKEPRQWASVFGKAESIGPLAVDTAGNRLLVGESFSGIVYSLALDSRRQGNVTDGMGSVNSLSIDRARGLLYIADSGRRSIWTFPLAGDGRRGLKVFYRSDELKAVTGVAADTRSNIWLGLYAPGEVIVLGPNGKQIGLVR